MLLSLSFAFLVGSFTAADAGFVVFCVLLPAGIAYFSDKDLFEKVKKRRMAIQLDFPDFVNKLTLLINAGMTVTKAWERTAADNSRQTPLYDELNLTLQDIRSGVPEHKAYEEFAKRCHVPVITRFISVILQNIKKGNAELVPFETILNECWECGKILQKIRGRASTECCCNDDDVSSNIVIVWNAGVLALKSI